MKVVNRVEDEEWKEGRIKIGQKKRWAGFLRRTR
jgi:hypothetical protein